MENANHDKETLRERFIQRENFWTKILQTPYPKGLNQELSMEIQKTNDAALSPSEHDISKVVTSTII